MPTPTGRDVSWSANLRRALGMMDAEFVLLCVDDLLLTKPVDTEGVLSAVSWAKRNDATALQLVSLESVWGRNWRGGNVPRLVPVGATYRATTVFTLWNRERLAGLLNPAESAWEFEYRSPARLPPDAGVFQVRRSYFSFVNAVVKGSLVPEAVKLCTRERYPLASSRPVLAGRELGRLRLARLRSAGLRLVPPAHRKVVRNLALGRLGE